MAHEDVKASSEPLDMAEFPDPKVQLLLTRLNQTLRATDASARKVVAAARLEMSGTTLLRIAAGKPDYLRAPPEHRKWNSDLEALYRYLEVKAVGGSEASSTVDDFDAAMNPYDSLFADALQKELHISDTRMAMVQSDMPGWYLAMCFSSTWPEGICVSLVRMDPISSGAVSYIEYQFNTHTSNRERYVGTAFGKSENRGVVACERNQGFLRVITQTMRSPHHGPLYWMRGICVSTVSNGSFVSPFYLEAMPADKAILGDGEQTAEDERRAFVEFAFRNLLYVGDWKSLRAKYRAVYAELEHNQPLRVWLGNFLHNGFSHLKQLEGGVTGSFARLPKDSPRPFSEAVE
ncbi:hypothetical protein [Caulobacter segnis]